MSTAFVCLVAAGLLVTFLILTHEDSVLTTNTKNLRVVSTPVHDDKANIKISFDKGSGMTDKDLHMLAVSRDWRYNKTAAELVSKASASLELNSLFWLAALGKMKKTVKCRVSDAKKSSKRSCLPSTIVGHQKTCSLVGNSGILLGSNCGREIDSRDFVIRMNLPLVSGFEKDVGTRTDMTVLNLETVRRLKWSAHMRKRSLDAYASRLRAIEGSVLVINKLSIHTLLSGLRQYSSRAFVVLASKTTSLGHGNETRGINMIASNIAGMRFDKLPTLGLTTVLMANTFCDRLYLYGFYPFQRDLTNRTVPYHYYPGDSLRPIIPNVNGNHNMTREYNLHRELHRQGVYKMHLGTCSDD
ncbi:PREDICTED: alpha-2,8-sialyltransferase 8B-like [Branchiostoma belcheri]|uniref:Alpha-2,8-sialyltransferase 8B-like n=1 Tax=Branchiostoma belcheri TaxID=7741 RepID=A0A6P4ZE91_BRABE|nr:PREDICTED: alpha-2,8-sialyltransferase 8B-like [Branchiostoma belcheri]